MRLISRPQKFLCFFYFEGNEMRKTIFVFGQRLNKHTMRKNLPKTFSVLKFRINLLNFSLKNISKNVKKIFFVYFY